MGEGVVLVGTEGGSTRIVAAYLAARHPGLTLVVEARQPRLATLRRRLRRSGAWATAGQAAFRFLVLPALAVAARRRIRAIEQRAGWTRQAPAEAHRVASINTPEARALLARLDPACVVINGTRILDRATLAAIRAPILNLHTGWTPRYRGVHGGYWALALGDPAHAGSTVHLVDAGIDTGAVVARARIEPTRQDNAATYPYLQLEAGLPLLSDAVHQALRGRLQTLPRDPSEPSRLHTHPTVCAYLRRRLRQGVR